MDGVICKTAEEFLDKIGRRSTEWDGTTPWVFRGQADAEWKLIPSVLRGSHLKPTWTDQVLYEETLVMEYYLTAQRFGLTIPEDSHVLHTVYAETVRPQVFEAILGSLRWPLPQILSLMALAQHYGIPTRLLDWSNDPFVAAYMAAVEVAKWRKGVSPRPSASTSDYLAIWAFDISATYSNKLNDSKIKSGQPGVRRIGAPSAVIPNLTAQKGLFTAVTLKQGKDEAPQALCLEDVVTSAFVTKEEVHKVLRKLVLPHSEAPRLLGLLAREFICAASMFPGYAGAAEFFLREVTWHEP